MSNIATSVRFSFPSLHAEPREPRGAPRSALQLFETQLQQSAMSDDLIPGSSSLGASIFAVSVNAATLLGVSMTTLLYDIYS